MEKLSGHACKEFEVSVKAFKKNHLYDLYTVSCIIGYIHFGFTWIPLYGADTVYTLINLTP